MKTIQVIILENVKTCRELNPLGDKKPVSADYLQSESERALYVTHKNNWQQAERDRKTFEIDIPVPINFDLMMKLNVGDICTATINEETNKAIIL